MRPGGKSYFSREFINYPACDVLERMIEECPVLIFLVVIIEMRESGRARLFLMASLEGGAVLGRESQKNPGLAKNACWHLLQTKLTSFFGSLSFLCAILSLLDCHRHAVSIISNLGRKGSER